MRLTASGAPPSSSGLVEGKLRFPRAWGVGGAWRPAARWTVALDLSWDNWRDAELDTPATGPISMFDGLPLDRTTTLDGANFGAPMVGSVVLPLAVGERNAREWRLKLSLILRVTDTDKLRRTVREVFGGG